MSQKFPRNTTASLYLIALAGNIAFGVENQYYNVFLYNVIAPSPFYVSLMVAITAVVSTLTAMFMGALSDVKGTRRKFMLYSFIFWAFTTAMFPFAAFFTTVMIAVTTAILFDSIMSFFGATAYDAAYRAYIVDISTLENRGKAIAINEIMTLVAILITYGVSGYIIEAFGYYIFFIIIGIITGILGLIGSKLAKDSPDLKPLEIGYWKHIKSTFRVENIRENKNIFLVLFAIGIWAIAFNIFFPFIIIYLQHYIGLDLLMSSLVIFIALLVSIILGIPVGKLVDRVGRKKFAFYSVFFLSVSLILWSLTTDLILLLIFGILWVLGMTTWHIATQTWVNDLFPKDKAGHFQGYYLVFNVLIGMLIGPFIGNLLAELWGTPIIIDGIPGLVPPPQIFFVAAILVLFSVLPLIKAKELPQIRE
jgi:MFS family permease